jgi:hypothetical protein
VDSPVSHDALGELYAAKMRKSGNLAVANFSHVHTWEKPDVVVWNGGFSVHVIETKISRSDFKRDAAKEWRYTADSFDLHIKREFERQLARHSEQERQSEERHRANYAAMNERLAAQGREPILAPPCKHYPFQFCHPQRVRGMGKYRSYLCPEGLISVDEVPERWGLIVYNSTTGKFRVKRAPQAFPDVEINHHAGAAFLLVIMKRMLVSMDNWRAAATYGAKGRFVSGATVNE